MGAGLRGGILAASVAAAVAFGGCKRVVEDPPARHVTARVLDQMRIGQTTMAEVERLLGEPDERTSDGALVYRVTRPRRETETFTFRFAGGLLSRICRTRS
jgi:hypothetical protein